MVTQPNVDADSYLVEDSATIAPKHGTTVQSGWGAAKAALKPKEKSKDYPTDFRFSDQVSLVRFLENEPFAVYEMHWIDRTEGKRSFVCEGDECPLCTITGDKPRARFAFNVLVASDEPPSVQILTAPPTFARQLQAANEDPRRGPLTKYYWGVSRIGTGRETQYNLERVRATDLAEEWELDSEELEDLAATANKYTTEAIYVSPHDELLELARSLVS